MDHKKFLTRSKILAVIKFLFKSIFYLILATLMLYVLDGVSNSEYFSQGRGEFWRNICEEQIILQAEKDEDAYYGFRTQKYHLLSPDEKKVIIEYEMSEMSDVYFSQQSYLMGKTLLAVQNKAIGPSSEEYVYIGEATIRNPQWLDNDHVIFTSSCGSNCEKVYLLNVISKELRVGKINSVSDGNFSGVSVFKDWSGQEFILKDRVTSIHVEQENKAFYLVFYLANPMRSALGERKFLFRDGKIFAK